MSVTDAVERRIEAAKRVSDISGENASSVADYLATIIPLSSQDIKILGVVAVVIIIVGAFTHIDWGPPGNKPPPGWGM